MPRWELLACAIVLALLAFAAFASTGWVAWEFLFDTQSYCERQALSDGTRYGLDYGPTLEHCEMNRW